MSTVSFGADWTELNPSSNACWWLSVFASYRCVKITPKLRDLKQQTFTISPFLSYKSESRWSGWFRVSQEGIVKIPVEAASSESLTGVEGSASKMARSCDHQGNFRSSLDVGRWSEFLNMKTSPWASLSVHKHGRERNGRERGHNVLYDLFLEVTNHHFHHSINQK